MVKLTPVHLSQIRSGNIPLDHDTILKACFIPGVGLEYQFFSCDSKHSSTLVNILCAVCFIRKVDVILLDNFND